MSHLNSKAHTTKEMAAVVSMSAVFASVVAVALGSTATNPFEGALDAQVER